MNTLPDDALGQIVKQLALVSLTWLDSLSLVDKHWREIVQLHSDFVLGALTMGERCGKVCFVRPSSDGKYMFPFIVLSVVGGKIELSGRGKFGWMREKFIAAALNSQ